MDKPTTILMFGCGLIGRSWSITFARAGCRVRLHDADAEAPGPTMTAIAAELPDLDDADLLGGATPDAILERIEIAGSLDRALDGVDYVQENTSEDVDVKRLVFAKLDAAAGPDTVLASSTSYIVPSAFTEDLAGRQRCLVAHPINPPHLVPAVELVPAPWTLAAVMDRARNILSAAGQSCIMMRREVNGFVMNRLQAVLLQESVRMVAEGYASTEDVDRGMRDGLGLRWSFMGPFQTMELNAPGGLRDYAARYAGPLQAIAAEDRPPLAWSAEVLDRIEEGRERRRAGETIADGQAWRDRRLIALAAHKRRQAEEEAGR